MALSSEQGQEGFPGEKGLLRRIAAGDELAYRQLFHLQWNNIYSVALVLTKSVELAEDMVQDIFLKIWQKREQLADIERFEDYLFIVARNHIYTELKKRSRETSFRQQVQAYFQDQLDNADTTLMAKESQALIDRAIGQLTPQQQLVYKLSREEGLSHEQIALRLNISRNTVRNHIVHSLKVIRTYLQAHTSGWLLVLCLLKIFFQKA